VRQVGLVDQDQWLRADQFGDHQITVDERLAERRFRRAHDDQLIDIGGERALLAARIVAHQQTLAEVECGDHALFLTAGLPAYAVAADDAASFLRALHRCSSPCVSSTTRSRPKWAMTKPGWVLSGADERVADRVPGVLRRGVLWR